MRYDHDKVLTAWNGLMIAALARAALLFGELRYLAAAARAAAFLQTHLTEESGGLLARWRAGDAAHAGKLDDYAFAAWGLLELYGASFRADVLAEACRLTERLLDGFFDWERGRFYPYASQGEQLITRSKDACDGAMPSGNAVAALVLSRLARLTGTERFLRGKAGGNRSLHPDVPDPGHRGNLFPLPGPGLSASRGQAGGAGTADGVRHIQPERDVDLRRRRGKGVFLPHMAQSSASGGRRAPLRGKQRGRKI